MYESAHASSDDQHLNSSVYAANYLKVVSAVQFHLPFYMSRPLPNTFALALVLRGLAGWLRGDHTTLINWMVPAVVIFRAELLVLLGPIMLAELLTRRITFGTMLTKGVSRDLFAFL